MNNKQLNAEATKYAERLLDNLMADKKEGTGFLGMMQKENDWDGIVAGLLNYVWDEKIALDELAENIADDADDRQAELAARKVADELDEITDALEIIVDCIDDWNTEYKNNNWTANVRRWIDENFDATEALIVRIRTAEKVAAEAAEWMKRCDYGKKARATSAIGRKLNEHLEVLLACISIKAEGQVAAEQEVETTEVPDLASCF